MDADAIEAIESLVQHVFDDKVDQLQAVLEKSPEIVNSLNEQKLTALGTACLEGRTRAASVLLATPGIDVNVRVTEMCVTPLYLAAANGFDDIIGMLLKFDCIDINAGFELCPPEIVDPSSDEARLTSPISGAADGPDPEHSIKVITQLLARDDLDIGGVSGERIKFALTQAESQCEKQRVELIKLLEDTIKTMSERRRVLKCTGAVSANGGITMSCMNISGDEVANIEVQPNTTIQEFRSRVGERLSPPTPDSMVCLLDHEGQLLKEDDTVSCLLKYCTSDSVVRP